MGILLIVQGYGVVYRIDGFFIGIEPTFFVNEGHLVGIIIDIVFFFPIVVPVVVVMLFLFFSVVDVVLI